jgi:hypothetical protein
MKISVIKEYREQIFSQIQEGTIPKQNICDLFDALLQDLESYCEFVTYAPPDPEKEKVVDMFEWRKNHTIIDPGIS